MSAKCMWKNLEDSIIEQRKILHITDISSSINQSLWVNLWGFPDMEKSPKFTVERKMEVAEK